MATKGGLSGNFHHPFGHFPLLLVFDTEGFECRTPPVVSPLVEPAGFWPLLTISSALGEGSLVICHCFRRQVFRCISSWMPVAIGGCASSSGRILRVHAARAFRTGSEKFSTHVSMPSRCAITNRTELDLPSQFGTWANQCASNQGDSLDGGRMNDKQCE